MGTGIDALSLFVQGDMGRIVQAYQRIFSVATVLISAVMSWLVESGAEILGGLAPVYVHDRGRSKDTDFAVFLIWGARPALERRLPRFRVVAG